MLRLRRPSSRAQAEFRSCTLPARAHRHTMPESDVAVPLTNVTKFVRQLSHDIRNSLNAAELQAAFVAEIATDDEVKSELKRLREIVGDLGASLQKLTSALGDIRLSPMRYSVRHFVEDLRDKVRSQFPDVASSFHWNIAAADDAMLEIDPQLLQRAMLEVFDNAVRYKSPDAKIVVSAETTDGDFSLKVSEPKTDGECDPSWWGREPMREIGHGRYGFGLYRAARIVAAHGGEMNAQYDRGDKCLISSVRLPLAQPE